MPPLTLFLVTAHISPRGTITTGGPSPTDKGLICPHYKN